ncbi:iron transporter [Iodidimonas muriae]|uniref:Iron transporter n=1 Tax=Iodidimonas muriae TaxID=261467 RepID=A0ABQ2L976_9PROT|nr:NifU family protein [Iodidimonas muriae]GER05904.1 iron transporter [Kordiimonadales bacterium JCM 17843]GGO07335.1 iron transporter [Iodidimonas muriae]
MFIQTEQTPNPATLKFLPGRTVLDSGTADFTDAEQAKVSPLADAIFRVSGVEAVFMGGDFITVTKSDSQGWEQLKPDILGAVMQHFTSGAPTLLEGAQVMPAGPSEMEGDPADAEIVNQIKVLLDEKVRPAVARDGGDITFHGFQEGVVYLHMQGACAGCPSSTMTLKQGIENLLRYYIPEITEVRPIA